MVKRLLHEIITMEQQRAKHAVVFFRSFALFSLFCLFFDPVKGEAKVASAIPLSRHRFRAKFPLKASEEAETVAIQLSEGKRLVANGNNNNNNNNGAGNGTKTWW